MTHKENGQTYRLDPDAHPADPRVQRTLSSIQQKAGEILEIRGWKHLTVKQLCMDLKISRSTYYQYFGDVWEPVARHLESMMHRDFSPSSGPGAVQLEPETLLLDGKPLSYFFFHHVAENRGLYRRVFEPQGGNISAHLIQVTAEYSKILHGTLREVSPRVVEIDPTAQYIAGALMSVAGWWMRSNSTKSPEEMGYWFSAMAAPGLLELMGLDDLLDG